MKTIAGTEPTVTLEAQKVKRLPDGRIVPVGEAREVEIEKVEEDGNDG